MPSIGSYPVQVFRIPMRWAERRSAIIPAPPGVDDDGVALGGWAADVCEGDTIVDLPGLAQAATTAYAHRRLHGYTLSVVDGLGLTWDDVVVMGVSPVITALAIGGMYRLTTTWRLLPSAQAAT